MDSSGKDYRRLYLLQDKFLLWWKTADVPFYLTGGTALGRYYLRHRYSEDLDFFVNKDPEFLKYIEIIYTGIKENFPVDEKNAQFTEDFTRIFISNEDEFLKIDFVNDVKFRKGKPNRLGFGWIDTPENILSNKLSALISRDEPKDVYDIIYISRHYAFNWTNIFQDAKEKAILNEIDIEKKLYDFQVEEFERVDWLAEPFKKELLSKSLKQITDDFLLGKDNSVCQSGISISLAKPLNSGN